MMNNSTFSIQKIRCYSSKMSNIILWFFQLFNTVSISIASHFILKLLIHFAKKDCFSIHDYWSHLIDLVRRNQFRITVTEKAIIMRVYNITTEGTVIYIISVCTSIICTIECSSNWENIITFFRAASIRAGNKLLLVPL